MSFAARAAKVFVPELKVALIVILFTRVQVARGDQLAIDP